MKSNYKHLLLRGYTVAAFIVMIAIGVIASIFKIQYKEGEKGEFALLRLDKNNYQAVLAAAEAATGVKVENLID